MVSPFGTPHPLARTVSLFTAGRLMRWALVILGLSIFIYAHTMSVPGLVDRVGRFKGSDYVQFYVMGSFMLDGRPDALYDADAHLAEGRRRIHPQLQLYAAHPNYGPQVALAFAPLALLPWANSLTVFLALMTVCYGVSVWLVWRECDALRGHAWLVAALAAASPLLWNVMRYAQASAIALLIWSAAYVALRRKHLFVAGLAIGCLIYKPQLGLVLGVALLASREWRVAAGAATAAAAQLGLAWIAGGSAAMTRYASELWLLALNPGLVEIYPSEIHSLRGFFQLLIPSPTIVTVCALAGLGVALAAAVRCWSSDAPLGMRWGQMAVLTVLASPHLVSYDLLLLTPALMLFADWAVRHRDHRRHPAIVLMLPLLYFAPFSGLIIANLTGVQASVMAMAFLAWQVHRVCAATSDERREAHDGRAQAGRGVVPELQDSRMAVEY